MLTEEIKKLMLYRVEQEELSNRLYLAMSLWLDYHGFAGAAKLWKEYADEETIHAKWAYDYLADRNVLVQVSALPAQPNNFAGLVDIIEKSLAHEELITKQCNDLAIACAKATDFMTMELAQQYLKEQAEEEARNQFWLDRLEAFGDSPEALRLLDNEMGCKV